MTFPVPRSKPYVRCVTRHGLVEGMAVTDKPRIGTRPVVPLLCNREHPHQQRMRLKTVGVHRVVAARLGPMPHQARCGSTHW